MVINLAMGAGFVGHTRNVIAWLGGSYPLRARRVVLNGCNQAHKPAGQVLQRRCGGRGAINQAEGLVFTTVLPVNL